MKITKRELKEMVQQLVEESVNNQMTEAINEYGGMIATVAAGLGKENFDENAFKVEVIESLTKIAEKWNL